MIDEVKKICKTCSFEGEPSLFKGSKCRDCKNQDRRDWGIRNKEKVSAYRKEYNAVNKEKLSEDAKIWYQNNRERSIAKHGEWVKINRNKIREYYKNRRNNPAIKLRQNISITIKNMLQSQDGSKQGKSIKNYLPYSIEELKTYLESLFEPWMTWENWGKYSVKDWNDNDSSTWTWQIDHIIPQSLLIYTSMEEENFQKCWALSNLRPYSAKQNNIDGNRR